MRLTRRYPDGTKKTLYSEDPSFAVLYDGVRGNPDSWLNFNKENRHGCMLFIDGECVYNGNLKPEAAARIIPPLEAEEKAIMAELASLPKK